MHWIWKWGFSMSKSFWCFLLVDDDAAAAATTFFRPVLHFVWCTLKGARVRGAISLCSKLHLNKYTHTHNRHCQMQFAYNSISFRHVRAGVVVLYALGICSLSLSISHVSQSVGRSVFKKSSPRAVYSSTSSPLPCVFTSFLFVLSMLFSVAIRLRFSHSRSQCELLMAVMCVQHQQNTPKERWCAGKKVPATRDENGKLGRSVVRFVRACSSDHKIKLNPSTLYADETNAGRV